jgi:predicted nuclease with TOPRIM domain
MKMNIKALGLVAVLLSLVTVMGCGVSKDKYEALLNDKIMLEEKASVLAKAKDALKNEYDGLLAEKMNLATQLETAINEKAALKVEYDKILDEKIALKAAYDKLLAESKGQQG